MMRSAQVFQALESCRATVCLRRTWPHTSVARTIERRTIFFDYSVSWLDQFYRVDVAVAPTRHSRPWLLVEAKGHSEPHEFRRSLNVLSGLAKASGARAVALLTKHVLSLATARQGFYEVHRRLESVDRASASEVLAAIGRSSLQDIEADVHAPQFMLSAKGEISGRFNIDRGELIRRLESACGATSTSEKGALFEALATYILSGLAGLEIRKRNVVTSTGELDVICRFNDGTVPTFFFTDDGYFLVECKNWQAPIGSKEIEAFVGKLQKCRSSLGLLFSRNGVTGRTGRDAVGNIEATWRQHGVIIVVITEETIRQVVDGYDFYSVLERLYEAVRFSER